VKHAIEFLVRVVLLAIIALVFRWASGASLSTGVDLGVIFGGTLLTFPLVRVGRTILDRGRGAERAAWITTFVHFALGFTFGVPIFRALAAHRQWPAWLPPVPPAVSLALVIVTGAASALVVGNLALRGLGAPFFIALSRRLATDWLYAWTRNPMVLAALAFFLALGVWLGSALFVLWVVVPFAPALLFFVKVFEERELELRLGAPYLEYRARTPMLWPRRPRGPGG